MPARSNATKRLHIAAAAVLLAVVAASMVATLSPSEIAHRGRLVWRSLAGETITARLSEAPGNGAAIGGVKVVTENAWFAARPSGTEDVYKIYAESFKGPEHLKQVQEEAREVVSAALSG